MSKDTRRSSDEIVRILAEILTNEPQSIGKLAELTKEEDELKYSTIERHIKLIALIQEIFADKKVMYEEQEIAGRVYKSAWIIPKK